MYDSVRVWGKRLQQVTFSPNVDQPESLRQGTLTTTTTTTTTASRGCALQLDLQTKGITHGLIVEVRGQQWVLTLT